eukprot:15365169-Ditylum_brightwellii.AAC.2
MLHGTVNHGSLPGSCATTSDLLDVQALIPLQKEDGVSPAHSLYQGFEMGDNKSNGGHLKYDFKSDEQVVHCDTFFRGAYNVFSVD